ncbi:MAG TPA: RidA family protein [Elusimicrobiales bacterium]|jgi:2-iminobutanoate/2-iminopropanoate deaminase|nr:RidA family protein [Elusimicrobiales bacterium]HPO94689.1 RidA family protein [Elusimicrobiales bacterium]
MKEIVSTDKAPKAIGPYSQAVKSGNFIFVSGQLPIDPSNQQMPQTVSEQTELCIKNIKNILESAGFSIKDIVKTTVFMTDLSKFNEMNSKYAEFFDSNPPARATVEVKALPKGATVEIEAIAVK